MKRNQTLSGIIAGALMGASLGCASMPPKELVEARDAYNRANQGPAQQRAPTELATAKAALTNAEKAFKDHGPTLLTQDLSYIALRKAEIADTQAGIEQNLEAKATAEKELAIATTQRAANQLGATEGLLAEAKHDVEASKAAAAKSESDAKVARVQTEAAEQRADEQSQISKEARDKLADIGKLQQDARGLVISLSGSVLFASGKSSLLPSASRVLNQVAEALTMTTQPIRIEGYTDSVGSDALNQTLSESRAREVRDYLCARGLTTSRVRSVGMGKSNPVSENETAEGRANNRRVEIVIEQGQS